MHPMRRLIALNEAPKKIPAVVSPEERDRVAKAHQAQQLAQAKAAAFPLKAKALQVAQKASHTEFYGPWDQTWVGEARAAIKAVYQQQHASHEDEHQYQLETNPNATPASVNMAECISEGFAAWWDKKKDTLDWSDGRYRWEAYMDAHPKTEQSDDMSRLRAEDEMLKKVRYRGGFGSIAEMNTTLSELISFMEDLMHYSDGGWSSVGSTSTELVKKGIPVIILYCKMIENLS